LECKKSSIDTRGTFEYLDGAFSADIKCIYQQPQRLVLICLREDQSKEPRQSYLILLEKNSDKLAGVERKKIASVAESSGGLPTVFAGILAAPTKVEARTRN
jgi:hypothetical protein